MSRGSLSLSLSIIIVLLLCTQPFFSLATIMKLFSQRVETRNKEGDLMVVVLILFLFLLFPLIHSIQTPHHCARQRLSPSFLPSFEEELQDIDSRMNSTSSSSHQSVSRNSCKKKLQLCLPVLTRMIRICEKHGAKWRKTKNTRTHARTHLFLPL